MKEVQQLLDAEKQDSKETKKQVRMGRGEGVRETMCVIASEMCAMCVFCEVCFDECAKCLWQRCV